MPIKKIIYSRSYVNIDRVTTFINNNLDNIQLVTILPNKSLHGYHVVFWCSPKFIDYLKF